VQCGRRRHAWWVTKHVQLPLTLTVHPLQRVLTQTTLLPFVASSKVMSLMRLPVHWQLLLEVLCCCLSVLQRNSVPWWLCHLLWPQGTLLSVRRQLLRCSALMWCWRCYD
jgi:hypothetical protein